MRLTRILRVVLFVASAFALAGCAAGGISPLLALAIGLLALVVACGGRAGADDTQTEDAVDAGQEAGAGGPSGGAGGMAGAAGAGGGQSGSGGISGAGGVGGALVEAGVGGSAGGVQPNTCGTGHCPEGMVCVVQGGSPWCLPDADGDAIVDQTDTCPYAANPVQVDSDLDGMGDACDLCPGPNNNDPCGPQCCDDPDGDAVPGTDLFVGYGSGKDNCPFLANPLQEDSDKDGVGDACDLSPEPNPLSPCGYPFLDSDGDGVADMPCSSDPTDTCPKTHSNHQADQDNDKKGDVCDPDGIAPLASNDGSAASLRSQEHRLQMRRAILERLVQVGALQPGVALIALSPRLA